MADDSIDTRGFPMAVMAEGGVALVGLMLAWLFDVPLREQMPVDWSGLAISLRRAAAATVPMLILLWFVVNSNLPPLRQLRELLE